MKVRFLALLLLVPSFLSARETWVFKQVVQSRSEGADAILLTNYYNSETKFSEGGSYYFLMKNIYTLDYDSVHNQKECVKFAKVMDEWGLLKYKSGIDQLRKELKGGFAHLTNILLKIFYFQDAHSTQSLII